MTSRQTLHDNTPVQAEFKIPATQLPESAQVVIVGGGIAGASIAYHFAKSGWSDVVLLEQNRIASGTTWHSAGQVGQLRSSSAQTKINQASARLYATLFEETGHDPGWLKCGGLQLASCQERMSQLQRNAAMADVFGVDANLVTPEECREIWPMLRSDDLCGGVYLPGDGRVLPGECTVALAKGAMQGGVKIVEGVTVDSLSFREQRNGMKRFTGIETTAGPIECEWVVIATNMWMRQIGLTAGVDIPVYPCEHHYLITRPIAGVTRDHPCTRDPDAGIYFRTLDDGGMKLGAFKKRSKPWQIGDRVPGDFAFGLLDPDWPDFAEPFQAIQHRLPPLTRDDVVKFVNGPEAFTPDNHFIMGQPFLTEGLFVAGGWNSAGIACAGGAGQYTVEWIENGGMTMDLCSVDIRRFLPFQNRREYLQERVTEVLGLHYRMAWPGWQMETARDSANTRASGILAIHQKQHACFGNTAGWERPLFYAPTAEQATIEYSFGKQNWFEWVNEEVLACRNNVAIIDQSTFGKFAVQGPQAVETLQRICGQNIDVPPNKAVYTGMFNERGTFESDLTVVRTDQDSFYLVTSTSQQKKDFDWISRHIDKAAVEITDVTDQINVVSVMGPNSQRLLKEAEPLAFAEQSTEYGQVRDVTIQGIPVRAIRVSYVGEDGWELHTASSNSARLYEVLLQAGKTMNVRPVGNLAVSIMRIEKGFRAYGHELSPEETPLEAGLGWAIDWNKDFLGKSALLLQKKEGLSKRLVCFVVPTKETILWGGEPILWDGFVAGYTSSACFSPTLDANIAMGFVRSPSGQPFGAGELQASKLEIVNLDHGFYANASFKPPVMPSKTIRQSSKSIS